MNKKYIYLTIIFLLIFSIVSLLKFIGLLPQKINYCNGMLGIDSGAAYDGPYYYLSLPTFKTISTCGGACMNGGCKPNTCPPPNWTCGVK